MSRSHLRFAVAAYRSLLRQSTRLHSFRADKIRLTSLFSFVALNSIASSSGSDELARTAHNSLVDGSSPPGPTNENSCERLYLKETGLLQRGAGGQNGPLCTC
jgi:hypothetical protein